MSYPAAPVPTPGRAGAAVWSRARADFGEVSDERLLAGFAAVLFRLTGREPVIDLRGRESARMRYSVSAEAPLREPAAEVRPGIPPQDAEFVLRPEPGSVRLHHAPALLDAATGSRLLDHVRTLLADADRHPDRPVGDLRLLPDEQARQVLVDWNRTATDLPHGSCLHEAFDAAADRAPQSIAVVHGSRRWTYAEVGAAADRLACRLRELGTGRGTRVAVCLDRSADLLISILAVLKAGGAYVPLDPGYPAERLAAMVTGTSCALLISRSGLAANLPAAAGRTVLLDREEAALAARPAQRPEPVAGPDDLCYVMHTSGSTGAPKPIALRHRGVMNNLADLNSRFGVGPGDSALTVSSPGFDMSVYEFLGLTTAGGTAVVPERTVDPAHWAALLAAERITIWNSAPALLALLADHVEQAGGAPPALRLVLLGGDRVPPDLPARVRAFSPPLRFVVMGGATEASIHSTIHEVPDAGPSSGDSPGDGAIPYGRPMANQRTYVLDDRGQPVPPGVAGELHLAGVGLARGYLDRPRQTAERFTDWSYRWANGSVTRERLYRTGDLVRMGPDGLLELLGRADFQIKINGLRIEPGEIEAVLGEHPAVRQAVVVAADNRLIGYVVPAAGRCASGRAPESSSGSAQPGLPASPDDALAESGALVDELGELVARRLPDYMVPAAWVVLDELPLSPNGKLDRANLPAPDRPAVPFRTARSPAEHVLAEVWADVLDAPRIGIDEDFVAAGGDSIKAVQVVTRARGRGLGITAGQVLRLRTIAALAPAATGEVAEAESSGPLVVVDHADHERLARRYPGLAEVWPVTPMQSGMLVESMLHEGRPDTYQLQVLHHLSGEIEPDRLRAACRALVARHASLRTAFVCDVDEGPVQVVLDELEPPWRELDLDGPEADAAVERFLAEDGAARFDPATPPLLRFALLRRGPRSATLVLTLPHMLIDGWSQQVLTDDLVRLHDGRPLEPARQFAEFLRWTAQQDPVCSLEAWAAELDGCTGPTRLAPEGSVRRGGADLTSLEIPLEPGELTGGAQLGVTANTVVQGAWAVLLAELTGRRDVVFGATVAGRPAGLVGVESVVGLFINLVPVRAVVRPDEPARQLLTGLHHRQAGLLEHQHLGPAEIHRAAGLDTLFDTIVAFQSYPRHRPEPDGLHVTGIEARSTGSYPLSLLVDDDLLTVQYDRNAFDPTTITAITTRFRTLVHHFTSTPDRPLRDLPRPSTPDVSR